MRNFILRAGALIALLSFGGVVSASAQLKVLQDALRDYAVAHKMRPLATPVAGLSLGSTVDQNDALLRSTCWLVKTVTLTGLSGETIAGVVEKRAGINLGFRILGLFGLKFNAGQDRVDSVTIQLDSINISEGTDAAFNWADPQCVATLSNGPMRVIGRTLQVTTLSATITTAGSSKVSLDSTSLVGGGVKGAVEFNLDASIGRPRRDGSVTIIGDSVAIARGINQWKLYTLHCPGEHLKLQPGAALRKPTNGCDDTGPTSGWYRARVELDMESKPVLYVQGINRPGANAPREFHVAIGEEFVVDQLPLRVDIGVLERVGNSYRFGVTRSEVHRDPRVLGAEAPLSYEAAVHGASLMSDVDAR